MVVRVLAVCSLLSSLSVAAVAQIISVKTVPISQADQFEFLPSRAAGMGGVSIALSDSLFDIGVNPARGSRLGETRFFSVPSMFSVTHDAGAGRSLPIGTAGRVGAWAGAFAATLQQIDGSQVQNAPVPFLRPQGTTTIPTDDGSHGNQFVFGSLARALSHHGWSVGASVFWADIHSMDGVDRLYAGSQSVRQSGHALDVRAGLFREWTGGALFDAVLLHHRLDMVHNVTFLDAVWDPGTMSTFQVAREDHNTDMTHVWGLHLRYQRPTRTPGLRVGGILTFNRMSHPKIPEYQFAQVQWIPWDPGHTNAFDIGVGISRIDGPATFAVDFMLEPIWTHTWGEAQSATTAPSGAVIPAGGRTVENYFHFINAAFRMGVDRAFGRAVNVQLGLQVNPVNYRFWQVDHVQEAGRQRDVNWVETLPTWGVRLHYPEFELSYQASITGGTGRPGVSRSAGCLACLETAASSDILAPPTSASTQLGGVSLITHRVALTVPLSGSPLNRSGR